MFQLVPKRPLIGLEIDSYSVKYLLIQQISERLQLSFSNPININAYENKLKLGL
jgi:hypothetical protein